jgi:hypothetical protein
VRPCGFAAQGQILARQRIAQRRLVAGEGQVERRLVERQARLFRPAQPRHGFELALDPHQIRHGAQGDPHRVALLRSCGGWGTWGARRGARGTRARRSRARSSCARRTARRGRDRGLRRIAAAEIGLHCFRTEGDGEARGIARAADALPLDLEMVDHVADLPIAHSRQGGEPLARHQPFDEAAKRGTLRLGDRGVAPPPSRWHRCGRSRPR